jgi:hypothetical protein
MAEYIERKAAIQEAEARGLAHGSTLGRHSGVADAIATALLFLPAADVAPVTRGKWIDKQRWEYRKGNVTMSGDTGAKCTACGAVNFTGVGNSHTRFCPNCGARMENV